jgi:hypothetical protein
MVDTVAHGVHRRRKTEPTGAESSVDVNGHASYDPALKGGVMRAIREALMVGALISVAGCGSDSPSGPSTPPPRANTQPSVRLDILTAGQAIVGVTPMTFSALGTDADGDALTYSWNFGDGRTATGSSTTTTFPNAGTFSVTVTADDGRGGKATATQTVIARTLEGTWSGGITGLTSGLLIEHKGGPVITGKAATSIQACGGRLDGLASAPRAVSIDVVFVGGCNLGAAEKYTATVDADLATMTGSYCIGASCSQLTFRRQ